MSERIRTLIVDDERYSREELKYLLKQHPALEIIGEADSGEQALLKTLQLKPEAVFLDVEMPLMNGLEAASALIGLKLPPKIVFATAYPQFGVEAFRFEALDYLLKPIDEERLAETVRRLEQSLRKDEIAVPLPAKSCGKLSLEADGEITFIAPDDIIYISREDAYSKIVTANKEYHVKTPLKELEAKLRLYPFFRIHKSYVVHLDYVKSLVPWFNGAFQLELKGCSDKLAVSRNYAKAFRDALEL
ncbi:LytR/AlgR family response regulator transcription factor [Paenibacillus lautus]|jgi:two-component system response regulator LytT|uniref:DNA-binding response regulator n=1 Tax=Paenibacillus lautus TaxID=1401 RepID=A0A385TJQ0_PAELA|nr:LytTR family DNA-binding domain-containing protein [Paenibacillus lautus]AYB43866.1 DNA-binding response regulator [Paenibacillus lautus]MBY0161444.1 response regulator transcription factor [Cytobacillus firmus]MCI1777548.1 LytTR family DNA-binding domain-containing protein [Paenibacillus lautus]